ncbi:hypothetical protein A2U01_0036827, partial [Trifolium medium]|nr:hypothetical protein [Trifolium medium]
DFVILEMPEDDDISLILGRPFLRTGRCLIDLEDEIVEENGDPRESDVLAMLEAILPVDRRFRTRWEDLKPKEEGAIEKPKKEPVVSNYPLI